jgi:hypothetical protein
MKSNRQKKHPTQTSKQAAQPWRAHDALEAIAIVKTTLGALSDIHLNLCSDHGLLPRKLGNAVDIAKFVLGVVIYAQNAQNLTGVPASLLIARAALEHGFLADTLTPEQWEKWFQIEARRLAKNPKFSAALKVASNPDLFLEALHNCKLWDSLHRGDLAQVISDYELYECDDLGLTVEQRRNRNIETHLRMAAASGSPLKNASETGTSVLYMPVKVQNTLLPIFMRQNPSALLVKKI